MGARSPPCIRVRVLLDHEVIHEHTKALCSLKSIIIPLCVCGGGRPPSSLSKINTRSQRGLRLQVTRKTRGETVISCATESLPTSSPPLPHHNLKQPENELIKLLHTQVCTFFPLFFHFFCRNAPRWFNWVLLAVN